MLNVAHLVIPEISCQCRTVHQVYNMSFGSFWHLHAIMMPYITKGHEAMSGYLKVGGDIVDIISYPKFPMMKSEQAFDWHILFTIFLEVLFITLHPCMELHTRQQLIVYGFLSMQ